MSGDRAQLVHDLRSPLARAKTLAKLLLEIKPGEEREKVEQMLLEALEDMDQKLTEFSVS